MKPPGAPAAYDLGVNVAVVGTGRWGQTLMRAITAHPEFTLVAAISSASAAAGSGDSDVPVFSSWQEAAGTLAIDGFVLALPPDRQPLIAEEIVKARIPVFLEKPMALRRFDVQRMLGAAQDFGFTGVVDHIHLFAPEFQELCRRLPPDDTELKIETVSGNRGPFRERWTSCWDWAPHDIAMCLAVMKAVPRKVAARVIRAVEGEGHVFENYEIRLDFGSLGQAVITTGNAFDGHCRAFRVRAGDLSLIYSESKERIRSLIEERAGAAETISIESIPPLDKALGVFAERIRRKTDNLEDLQAGAQVVNICAAAHESVLSAHPVAVPAL